jgi:hypothetical protein
MTTREGILDGFVIGLGLMVLMAHSILSEDALRELSSAG